MSDVYPNLYPRHIPFIKYKILDVLPPRLLAFDPIYGPALLLKLRLRNIRGAIPYQNISVVINIYVSISNAQATHFWRRHILHVLVCPFPWSNLAQICGNISICPIPSRLTYSFDFEHLSLYIQKHLSQSVAVCDIRGPTCISDAIISTDERWAFISCQIYKVFKTRY